MESDRSVEERIDEMAARARAAEREFEPPVSPPADDRAMQIVRDHVGPAVSTFLEIRTGDRSVHLPPESYERLEWTMNAWLARYTACYGVETEPDCRIRTAAQLLLDTHNARDVAQILTGVPER